SPDDVTVDSRRLREAARGMNALIVDDEPIVHDILSETLEAAGFGVERSDNAVAALKRLEENDYNLIISDIKMPGLDGKEFYREVKKIRPEALKRIIFISGDSVSPETREFLKETGNASLKKPFNINTLNAAVLKLISGKP
ncbi:MAG: response regulator, partial [Deltaproteobacteria bacterium]|nr:response regulator [Deltaproteobacteria bacterium]